MSRDDEIDYRVMYPIAGRNRKRRSANPRPQKKPEPQGGFFRDKPTTPTKDVQKKNSEPRSKISSQYRRDPDTLPAHSMATVAMTMWADNLDLTVADVIEQLEEMGYEAAPITISSIKQEMFKVLRLCAEHGSIKILHAWRD
jgi:hypothetical protein